MIKRLRSDFKFFIFGSEDRTSDGKARAKRSIGVGQALIGRVTIQSSKQSYLIDRYKLRMSAKKKIGKYILFQNQKLGEGAFSKVYNGIIYGTEEVVAIKVVAKSMIEKDEYTKNAFYSEINIMKKLKCPNIVKFLDVHETRNNFYIVLEKADYTLRQFLRRTGRLSEKMAMICLIQILNGFGQLVKNGVIHRDLKPENILICNESLVKIADFGFAKHLESNSLLKTMVGTPTYMAPQILMEEKYSYKCDIWSLGVVTYELMVGKMPWNMTNPNNLEELRKEIFSRKIVIPTDISEGVRDFILGCLVIKEADRYDWERIFLHQIFGERYNKNFTKQGSTKITFILSNFRINLHSKNLSLTKILSKLGDELSKNDFSNFVKMVYREITEEDTAIFFNYIARDNKVRIDELVEFLKKHQCRMTGVSLAEKQMEMEVEYDSLTEKPELEVYELMDRLCNSIQKSGIVISNLFKGINTKVMSYNLFAKMIGEIDPSLDSKSIQCLFEKMDGKADGTIEVEGFYRMLCKIAQENPM